MALMASAALVGGALTASAVVAVETVVMVGLAVSVVGAVTENKTLTKIGAGLGLGAGAVGIYQGAVGAGAAEATAETAATETVATDAATQTTGNAMLESAGMDQSTAAASSSVTPTTSEQVAAAGTASESSSAANAANATEQARKVNEVAQADSSRAATQSQAATAMPEQVTPVAAQTTRPIDQSTTKPIDQSTTVAGTPADINAGIDAAKEASQQMPWSRDGGSGAGFFSGMKDFWGRMDYGDKQILAGGIKGLAAGYAASSQGDAAKEADERRRRYASDVASIRYRGPTNSGVINSRRTV